MESNNWSHNIVRNEATVKGIAMSATTVAVLGIKTEKQHEQPAFFVPEYLQKAGVKVVPVPVFYPEVTEILGETVFRKVADVPAVIDVLVIFRKPSDLPSHLEDILTARPKVVWLQTGIRNPEFEEQLARAGMRVVADRCLMVEHGSAMRDGIPSNL
ncbi:hypothetical protein CEUSTIGMA_g10628.t1 [Chlamydomonas eustigma]|uniref:CoA-binding domain-containing protein n=1 Tax=Chlamydomonas eustigma TaxID=1157962 RepID=A0A250XJW1_9CHLO|nr:hypothetical protein CEUSTIGMA_g10628.t1 [Chlamydomonas eustigma]|eukprot:GAX83202.1 hypothetical protein CEUSTIGMA_g10628.t1 [Chlamydomonas eustigma]